MDYLGSHSQANQHCLWELKLKQHCSTIVMLKKKGFVESIDPVSLTPQPSFLIEIDYLMEYSFLGLILLLFSSNSPHSRGSIHDDFFLRKAPLWKQSRKKTGKQLSRSTLIAVTSDFSLFRLLQNLGAELSPLTVTFRFASSYFSPDGYPFFKKFEQPPF